MGVGSMRRSISTASFLWVLRMAFAFIITGPFDFITSLISSSLKMFVSGSNNSAQRSMASSPR